MNETLAVIDKRKSVRAYEPGPLEPGRRDAIVQAALRAPTAGNQMLYSILEIEDPALKERLAVTCDNQPFIAKAPLVLVFLADYQRWFDFFRHSGVEELCRRTGKPFRTPEEGDLMLALSDALIAAQTAVIAAESLGIGSCYIGDIMENYEIHRDLLGLPPFTFPIAMVCFGMPTEGQRQSPRRSRYREGLVVFKDAYRRLAPEELAEMEDDKPIPVQSEAVNTGQRVYLRKFGSTFMQEMNRSVRLMLSAWSSQTTR
jgi:FMN reductase (NADPH)/FMN reductase [NAD(P)H]